MRCARTKGMNRQALKAYYFRWSFLFVVAMIFDLEEMNLR